MKRTTFLLAAAVLAGAVTAAWAQTPTLTLGQSPGNAHAFLQAVSQSQAVLVTDAAAPYPQPLRLSTVESSGCLTRLIFQDGERLLAVQVIDWRAVRTARAEGEAALRLRGPAIDTVMAFETAEMAGRMGNALNIVRRACDPTQGYGF